MSVVRGFVDKMNRMGPGSKAGCESLLLVVAVCILLERWVEPVERYTRNSIEVLKSSYMVIRKLFIS